MEQHSISVPCFSIVSIALSTADSAAANRLAAEFRRFASGEDRACIGAHEADNRHDLGKILVADQPGRLGCQWRILGRFEAGIRDRVRPDAKLPLQGHGVMQQAEQLETPVVESEEHADRNVVDSRFLGPVEVPGLAALGVAGLVLAVSRILLALPKEGSYVVFGLVPAIILVLAYLVVSRPQLSQSAIAGMLLIGAVALLFVGLATRRREVGAMLVALLVANLFDLTFFSSGLAYGAALAAGFSRRTREHA